jgi:FkbM family methyltransferase
MMTRNRGQGARGTEQRAGDRVEATACPNADPLLLTPSSLAAIQERFRKGSLPKRDYIEAMHGRHRALFEYADFIRDTEVAKIEIVEGEVIWSSRAGVRFVCNPEDRRSAPLETLNFGRYEGDDARMVWRLLRPGFTILDIGANVGWYTLHFARKYPTSRVFAFEPIPATFACLERNLRLNGLDNVSLFNFGLFDREEELTFYSPRGGSDAASAANLSGLAEVTKITCRVKRLDDFMAQTGVEPDFIKCDVEGAELFVFRGAMQCLLKYRPIIFCEMLRKWSAKFGYHPNEIIDLLGTAGYRCFCVQEGRWQQLPRVEETTVPTNFFFLQAERHVDVICRLTEHRKDEG